MSCESLSNVLAAIDKAISEYNGYENRGYTDFWRKQIDSYRRETQDINRQMADLQKQRIRDNGGYTRGVRG